MTGWIWRGLRRGIVTTGYPRRSDAMPSGYRGRVRALDAPQDDQRRGAAACPTRAIDPGDSRAVVDRRRCIQCGQCARVAPDAFAMDNAFAIAQIADAAQVRAVRAFRRSIHLRHVDTGSDGSEEQELQAMFNPFYDANRLGIFMTATPRHADVLIVTGPVTHAMKAPLERVYEAMPDPKIVIALGTTACSGGILSGDAIAGPVDRVLPVDVYIPGSPPAPLTILHGILAAMGRVAEDVAP